MPCFVCCCGPDRISTIAVPLGHHIYRWFSTSRNYFCPVHAVNSLRLTAVTNPNTAPALANVAWTAVPAAGVVAAHHVDISQANAGGPMLSTASLNGNKSVNVYVVEVASLVCTNGVHAGGGVYDIDAAPNGHAEIVATPNPSENWFLDRLPWVWVGGNARWSSHLRRVPRNQVANTVVSVTLFGQTRQITVQVNQVEAVLQLERVSFVGSTAVDCDSLGAFDPVWERTRADPAAPINQPLDQYNGVICYRRNQTVRLTVELSVTTRPFPAEDVTIEGTANFGGTQLTWTAANVNIAANANTVTVANIDSDVPLPNRVDAYAATTITWTVTGAGGARAIGQTQHDMYAMLGASLGGPNYWTLLEMSCGAANAALAAVNSANGLVAALNAYLAGTVGTGNGHQRARDGTRLSYWAQGRNTPFLMTTDALMSDNSGTGRCNAWQFLFMDTCRLHGVATAAYNVSARPGGFGFNVANLQYNDGGTPRGMGEPPLIYDATVDCLKQAGLPGQSNDNPMMLFTTHAMVQYGGQIYDPSYGTGPHASMLAWERASLAGVGVGLTNYNFAGQPLQMSSRICRGFATYTLVMGDNLGTVAIANNVLGGAAALYNHALNYLLRAARPGGAGTVVAGDVVVIPRDISDVMIVGAL